MAFLTFKNVQITGISACVPRNIEKNSELTSLIPPEDIDKTINNIGIKEKRVADDSTCASDLCFSAASQLLGDMKIDKNSIDVLIFMSQAPDFYVPATAPILQNRLGLPNSTACFDMNLGCSGYLYGLSLSFSLAMHENIKRVLFLDGETFTKVVSKKDRVNAPLYGDAGTATLIEKSHSADSYFSLFTDGSGKDALFIKAGGARYPSSESTLEETLREDGNIRSDHQLFMDGIDVFNFTIRVVPKNILEILEYSKQILEDVDYVIFHQANKFMTDFFAKKLKIPAHKVPYCLDRFGNTSSASIPLTIVSELREKIEGKTTVILSGFGAGLSWGSALLNIGGCHISKLLEY
jgi:3-oxoacyl-[acyl-carrier-protein] synthase-3